MQLAVTCPSLSISNGRIEYSPFAAVDGRYRIGTKAKLTKCNFWYSRKGTIERFCQSNRRWSGSRQRCQRKNGLQLIE